MLFAEPAESSQTLAIDPALLLIRASSIDQLQSELANHPIMPLLDKVLQPSSGSFLRLYPSHSLLPNRMPHPDAHRLLYVADLLPYADFF
jgi:hypothetical protein